MPLVIGAGFGITGSEITLGKGPGIIGDGITGDGIGIGTLTGGGLRFIGNGATLTGGGLRFIGNGAILPGGRTFIGSATLMRPGSIVV